mmetsp:Transcript_30341/g.68020  ORF Transcript_30341/g.68020 Transcript_30341/m.68020 type:complete len:211 (-) Transcript_30341:885-1517(-)
MVALCSAPSLSCRGSTKTVKPRPEWQSARRAGHVSHGASLSRVSLRSRAVRTLFGVDALKSGTTSTACEVRPRVSATERRKTPRFEPSTLTLKRQSGLVAACLSSQPRASGTWIRPLPMPTRSPPSMARAVDSTALRSRLGDSHSPRPLAVAAALRRARHPHALGLLIEVPFISCLDCRVQVGTGEMAAPGAAMLTPRAPSRHGPTEDQV